MSFLTPTFLAGLAGAGLPLAIHLITRDRVRRVPFSTLRFFLKSSRHILRRRRLRELILLGMRMLACALLAVAFARPILGGGEDEAAGIEGALKAATARVVVADLSASMRRKGCREGLVGHALAAVDDLTANADAAALVTFADSAQVEEPMTRKVIAVRERIVALEPGFGAANVPEALRTANEMLRPVTAPRKEIVLVSDLQRSGWRGFRGDWRLAPGVRLIAKACVPESADEVAIVAADCPEGLVKGSSASAVTVRVANFSKEELRGVEVGLTVAGEEVGAQQVNLRPGGAAAVRFRHVFALDGDNAGEVAVRREDAATENNSFHFNTRVIPRIRAVILNGRPSARPLDDAAFFLKAALAPSEESPFEVKVVPASGASPEDLDGASVAILADVRSVPAAVGEALGGLLARGGGLLFMPGRNVDARVFAEHFASLAPCKLRRAMTPRAAAPGEETRDAPDGAGAAGKEGSAARPAEAVLTKIDFDHPIFEAFLLPHHGDLGIARFRRYWEVTDSQLSRVSARFDDGRPAVLEREIAGGVSMLVASPADLGWNDFPRHAVFLPFLHQATRYLAIRTEQKTGYLVGERLPVREGATVAGPDGEPLAQDRSRASPAPSPPVSGNVGRVGRLRRSRTVLHELVAVAPGIYTTRDAEGSELRYAVNLDFGEADPATIAPEELAAALEQADDGPGGEAGEADADGGGNEVDEHNIWWYVVFAVAALAAAELVLGNRTQRH